MRSAAGQSRRPCSTCSGCESSAWERRSATITIRDRTLAIAEGAQGRADLTVTADGKAWLQFLRKERGLFGLLLSRKLRLRGSPRLLLAFGRCFP